LVHDRNPDALENVTVNELHVTMPVMTFAGLLLPNEDHSL
jgi:hypothetical protein